MTREEKKKAKAYLEEQVNSFIELYRDRKIHPERVNFDKLILIQQSMLIFNDNLFKHGVITFTEAMENVKKLSLDERTLGKYNILL